MKTLKQNLLIALLVVVTNQFVYAQKSNAISPEEFGFSSQKLKEMEAVIQGHVDKKEFAGVLTLLARRGEIFYFKTYGYQDLENKIEIQKNSIFRLASVSKIVTGVAALICYEEGLFLLDDPVKKYIPEFGDSRVLVSVQKGEGTDSLITEPLKRDITIRDLL